MGRYRKRPVVVDAMQWTGLNLEEVKEFVGEALTYDILDTAWEVGKGRPHVFMKIKTLEGDMEVSEKDFIIKDVNGEFYPCKPDIFQKTYMPESTEDKPIGRLIDADKLNFSEQHYNKSQTKAILDFVDTQPTAYDADEVIKRLKKLRDCKYLTGITNNAYEFGACDVLNDAIKIIKAGGDIELSEHSKSQGN